MWVVEALECSLFFSHNTNDNLKDEAEALEARIISVLEREDTLYSHVWSEGEVIISDNLAVAHKASKDTQRLVSCDARRKWRGCPTCSAPEPERCFL